MVKGMLEQLENEFKWLYQGLVMQFFSLSFMLVENMEVFGVMFINGLLYIDLICNELEIIVLQCIVINECFVLNS